MCIIFISSENEFMRHVLLPHVEMIDHFFLQMGPERVETSN